MRIKLMVAEQAKLKAHREGRTINKNVIAEESGVSWPTVDGYWENKTRRYDEAILLALCNYFECELSDLLVVVNEDESEVAAVALPAW